MNKKMILLFSHKLTDQQVIDAKNNYNIDGFLYLPIALQNIWSNIPPNVARLENLLDPIKTFIEEHARKDDLILIQGDFGASFVMVNFSKNLKLVPVYATTERLVKECIENNEYVKKTIFKHRRFRKYE